MAELLVRLHEVTGWTSRYLAVLGLPEDISGLDGLTRLCRAHVQRIPFENTTALARRAATPHGPVPPVDLEATLAAWERNTGGGVCFEAGAMCCRLLTSLGYQAQPVLGTIAFPGSHQAARLTLPEGEFLVDVACGSPIMIPVPLSGETRVEHAGLTYRFLAGEAPNTWLQQRLIDGAWQTFCSYNLTEPDPQTLKSGYQRHHNAGETWVTNTLTLVRCTDTEVIQLRNDQFTRYTAAGKTSETIADADATERLVAEVFSWPHLPVRAALLARDRFVASPSR